MLAGSGLIPGPEPLWLEVERHAGWAEFHLGLAPWARACPTWWAWAAGGWRAQRWPRRRYGPERRPLAWRPPSTALPVPWLAVALLPSVVLLSQASVALLGDLERVILWTLATTLVD